MPNVVTVKQRKTSGPNRHLANQTWTFTDDLNATFHEETGIAFDGRFLWFCTTGAALRPPKLLAVDPVSRQQNIPSFDLATTANASAIDIVWNGYSWDDDRWGLYLLTSVPGFPIAYEIYLISHQGHRLKRLTTGLSVASPIVAYSALAWDGRYLYIQHQVSTAPNQRFAKWDPVSNTRMYDVIMFNSGQGTWGLVHTGRNFLLHGDIFGFLHGVWSYFWRVPTQLQLLRQTVAEAFGGVPFVGPCTFDGTHMYTFEL